MLALSTLLGLAQACAPAVAPESLLSVVGAESGFDPLVVGLNGARRRIYHPATADTAAALAARLIARGRSVDLGLGQINSRNLERLHLSVRDAFDPCRNLAASGHILRADYVRAAAAASDPQRGLRSAFSLYNTGDLQRGFRNGYVARVTRSAAEVVPAIRLARETRATAHPPTSNPRRAKARSLDVFARGDARAVLVF